MSSFIGNLWRVLSHFASFCCYYFSLLAFSTIKTSLKKNIYIYNNCCCACTIPSVGSCFFDFKIIHPQDPETVSRDDAIF